LPVGELEVKVALVPLGGVVELFIDWVVTGVDVIWGLIVETTKESIVEKTPLLNVEVSVVETALV
jgi:hypothetical protein